MVHRTRGSQEHEEEGGSIAINRRLNRWSFRKLQEIIDYKAKLSGLNVRYVDDGRWGDES